ncbi:MAG TPA: hypothetical protein VMZ27_08960 [Candidatus Saccharimonadales bacterium]|nr:hypothetical protein [Candidatus Saccharimonadales bacterium]
MKEHLVKIYALAGILAASVSFAAQNAKPGVVHLAKFSDSSIDESSGLAASKRYPGIFWTHNDQGHDPVLFAVNRAGKTVAKFKIVGVNVNDWEDVAIDNSGHVYIADTGNNDGSRDKVQVYMLQEPAPKGSGSVRVQKTWKLSYPSSGSFNGEAFFINNGYGYLVGKDLVNSGAPVYRFPLSSSSSLVLQRVGTLKVNYRVTGAAVSTDNMSLGIVTENGAYVFPINGVATRAFVVRPFFTPLNDTSMEGGTFAGDGFLVSSEKGDLFLFNQPPFRKR